MKIILVIMSALRVDHLSVYGNRWLKTENFEKLDKAGRVFTGMRGRGMDPVGTRMELLTGLDSRRWRNLESLTANLRAEWSLPGQLERKGDATALFTDNFPLFGFYENLNAFERVHFVPGQGSSRHMPAVSSKMTSDLEESGFNQIVSGTSRLPEDRELANYARNRSLYPHVGHPSVRLFDAVGEYTRSLEEQDWFVLVDSYGLGPPWDAPKEFAKYRSIEDLKTLAWPVAGPIDTSDGNIQKKLNFLRRAYADNCLFMDHLIGRLGGEGITLVVMSDHGVLIGDGDYVLGDGGHDSQILCRQVMITQGPGIESASRSDQDIRPVDVFATLCCAFGAQDTPGTDGREIEGLVG